MGYRINISSVKPFDFSTKLYGYVNMSDLQSYKYLIDNRFINSDAIFDYGFNNKIELNKQQFKEFFNLYLEDFKNNDPLPPYSGKNIYEFDEVKEILTELDDEKNNNTYIIEWFWGGEENE